MTDVLVDCVDPDRTPGELQALRQELVRHARYVQRLAEHYSLLGGETRLKILGLLKGAGELCVCDLAAVLGMTPAAVSQHLARLRSGKLVASRRDGMTVYYRLADEARDAVSAVPTLSPVDPAAEVIRGGRAAG